MGSKSDILQAAMRVFLRKGYEKASMQDIVNESGFAKGGIYHHFKNKKAIFLASMENLMMKIDNWNKGIFSEKQSLKEILHTYFVLLPEMKKFLNSISRTENVAEFNYYILIFEGMQKNPEFKKQYFEKHDSLLKGFSEKLSSAQEQGIIKANLDVETFAFIIHALIEGTYLFSLFSENIDLNVMSEKMFDTIWKAISTE